jgi:hypothetical protein
MDFNSFEFFRMLRSSPSPSHPHQATPRETSETNKEEEEERSRMGPHREEEGGDVKAGGGGEG